MNTTKTLMLATITALSLGLGSAMAQESAGPLFNDPAPSAVTVPTISRAVAMTSQPQAGASDVDHARSQIPQQVLIGADGNA